MNIYDIENPEFLKELNIVELNNLADDIRTFLIDKISQTGGHISSNLGVVELTIALHKVFNSPVDKIIFDVSHQSYVHKILTGRAKQFDTLRKFEGLSGFIRSSESKHDIFEAGHSSTSISAQAGFEVAKEVNSNIGHTISLIGDGSINSGLAFEGLNFMGDFVDKNPIIILNDNNMSISKNVGSIKKTFNRLRSSKYRKIRDKFLKITPKTIKKISKKADKSIKLLLNHNNLFDDLGYMYIGPIDGHNIKQLVNVLELCKNQNRPILLHVSTIKGKGYEHAENDKIGKWHGVGKFNLTNGEHLTVKKENMFKWSCVISDHLLENAKKDDKLYVITPAMIHGSCLGRFSEEFPNRLIDVGISEAHSVVMASSMAMSGLNVFLSIYSTFSQRAYDQIIHDVCRQNTKVIFGIDRAGLVGEDGDTHQGIYDIPMLMHIPNIIIVIPHTAKEAKELLDFAMYDNDKPIAIRYPRGQVIVNKDDVIEKIKLGSWKTILKNNEFDMNIISYSKSLDLIIESINEKNIKANIINARFIKPLDYKMLDKLNLSNKPILIYEESTVNGGLGMMILKYFNEKKYNTNNIHIMGIDDKYVEHGDIENLLIKLKLDKQSIIKKCLEILGDN